MAEKVMPEKREYTGKVFLKFPTGEQTHIRRKSETGEILTCMEPVYGNWAYAGEFRVRADSLDDALNAIESESKVKHPTAFVHLDSVYREREKNPIYKTAWDETGPLAFVRDAT